ncbi:MAG: hypothetical protein Q9166_005690 [cf. Caloplaca sp. 2 TL-2023]
MFGDNKDDYDDGGPIKITLRPVPVGEKKDNFMFIDMVQQVRAVYFPVAHKSGPHNEDLCSGLCYRHHETLCFDVRGIYNYLIIPRQMRNPEKGLYKTATVGEELITLFDCHRIVTNPSLAKAKRHFLRSIDLNKLLGTFRLSWLGLVPKIGPLLAVSWSIGVQAIMNPDAFEAENVLHLSADVLQAVVGTAIGANPNVPKGIKQGGGAKAPKGWK